MRRQQQGDGTVAVISGLFVLVLLLVGALVVLGISQVNWIAEQRSKCEAAGGVYKLGGEGGDDICFRREQVIDLK